MQNTNKHPYTLLTALNFRFRMLCAWKTRREGIQPSKQSLQLSWAKSWLHTSPDFPLSILKTPNSLHVKFPFWFCFLVFSQLRLSYFCSLLSVWSRPRPDSTSLLHTRSWFFHWCVDRAREDDYFDFYMSYSVLTKSSYKVLSS